MNKNQTMVGLLDFWFTQPMSQHWFSSSVEIDQMITDNYEPLWQQARAGERDHWQESAEGCLALCIVLDQLPLNMFRGQAKSFSTEQQAGAVTKYAISKGFETLLDKSQVAFLLMPLMHSENLADQDLSLVSFEKAGLDDNKRFAKHHRELIKAYGRFPHRNLILGRKSTSQEIDYLNSDKAFKG